MLDQSDMYMVATLSDNPIESLNLWQSLAGQQENSMRLMRLKRHIQIFPCMLNCLFCTPATAHHKLVGWMAFLVLLKEVGDEAKIGAITAPMDFTITDPSQVYTAP